MSASVRFRLSAAVFAFAVAWRLLTPSLDGAAQPPSRPADLPRVAAGLPAVAADLFRALAHPSDRVQLSGGEVIDIEPLGSDALLDPDFAGNINARGVGKPDQPADQILLTRGGVAQYTPYERQALDRIGEFEKAAQSLPALDRLTTMETGLAVVLRYSMQTRDRPLKGAGLWQALQGDLDRKLLETRRFLLRQRTASAITEHDWQQALRLGDHLETAYPGNNTVLIDIARQRMRAAGAILLRQSQPTVKDYAEIHRYLGWVDGHFEEPPRPDPLYLLADALGQSGSPMVMAYHCDVEAVRQVLIRKAAALVNDAGRTSDNNIAVRRLQEARAIWPRLPGLEDALLRRQGKDGILRVGVRALPKYHSPQRAVLDSELQALELLFEGVVQMRPAKDGSLVGAPQLAAALPQTTGSERRVFLKKTAYWSNGSRVSSGDVQKTFELLTSPNLPGHNTELADQLEPIRAGNDPFHWTVKFQKGLLDPLAPFTFKVLPREYRGAPLAAADNEAFALAPVGSGRYMLAEVRGEQGRAVIKFVANPYYAGPGEMSGSPFREVHFCVSSDPVADFASKTAPLRLLLDVPTAALGKLKSAGVELRTLPTRRVWFLAVNHRVPMLADEDLRRALAHGLNREQLLADSFGGGRPSFRTAAIAALGSTLPVMAAARAPRAAAIHHPLNGPFPAGSWACSPAVPVNLFDRDQAVAYLKKAKSNQFDLELKYPDDDPVVADACQAIAVQLGDLGQRAGCPIKVRLVARTPHVLQRDLQTHDYQLAYWRHDFATDEYALWPLFDPRPEALATGSNYLGFKDNDGTLAARLQQADSHRDFSEVKRLTQEIHVLLYERMPLIPLWQLDYHIAIHPSLKLPTVDPLRVFSNIDEWRSD